MVTQTEQTVLLPDKLYNELAQEVATEAETKAFRQAKRSELGKMMGLDVGPPSEMVILANGQHAEGRDYLGMALDTRLYAKKKCNTCYGRGTVTMSTPIATATALSLIAENPANEALLHQRELGKYSARSAVMCSCAKHRYRKLHAQFANSLVKSKLATFNGSVRVDKDGHRQDVIELL